MTRVAVRQNFRHGRADVVVTIVDIQIRDHFHVRRISIIGHEHPSTLRVAVVIVKPHHAVLLAELSSLIPLLDLEQLGRSCRERSRERHQFVARRDLLSRVATVQRLDPHQRRRFGRYPSVTPRAGRHSLDRQAVLQREVGDRVHGLSTRCPKPPPSSENGKTGRGRRMDAEVA